MNNLRILHYLCAALFLCIVAAQATGYGDAIGLFVLLAVLLLGIITGCVRAELAKLHSVMVESHGKIIGKANDPNAESPVDSRK